MAFIDDEVFDQGLDYIAGATGARIDICSQEPTNHSEATTKDTYSLGYKTGLTLGATEDDVTAGLGRKVEVPLINDGTVDCTTSGTATHWALTDGTSILLATGALTSSQLVTDGNTFTLDAISITHRDATSP